MARLPVAATITGSAGNRRMSIPQLVNSINTAIERAYEDMPAAGGGDGWDDITVATGAAGSQVTFNATTRVLTIPRGATGTNGTNASLADVNIATGEPGTNVTYNASTNTLTIPRGADGSGGGSIPSDVARSQSRPTGAFDPAHPWLNSVINRYGSLDLPSPVGHTQAIDIRAFGTITMQDFRVNTPTPGSLPPELTTAQLNANTAAFLAAEQWAWENGGLIQLPGGMIDINDTIVYRGGVGWRGVGEHHTVVRQRAVARTGERTQYADVFVAHPTLGAGFFTFENMFVHGGWESLREVEGGSGTVWEYDMATSLQKGIGIATLGATETAIGNGPGPSKLYPNGGSDAQGRVRNVKVGRVKGYGIHAIGRGEVMFNHVWTERCARNGLMTAIADSWYDNITCALSGDSAIKALGGSSNARWNNIKGWYGGAYRSAEVVGAGFEMPDAGTQNVIATNLTTQDTWGPGLVICGNTGIDIQAQVDEAGGGRLPGTTPTALGYQGARSKPRVDVRLPSSCRDAKIRYTRAGGWRGTTPAAADLPYLVDIEGTPENVHIEISGALSILQAGTTYTVDQGVGAGPNGTQKKNGVLWSGSGYTNAKRYNTVKHLDRMLFGQVTLAELADSTHGVNDPVRGPTQVITEFGMPAFKRAAAVGGGWEVMPIVMTESAYNALSTGIRARGNFITTV